MHSKIYSNIYVGKYRKYTTQVTAFGQKTFVTDLKRLLLMGGQPSGSSTLVTWHVANRA